MYKNSQKFSLGLNVFFLDIFLEIVRLSTYVYKLN